MGAVGYNYRVATTPVTNLHWLGFVRAYHEQFGYPGGGSQFTGAGIVRVGDEYLMFNHAAHHPVNILWRYAAMYTNWLHNGKAATPEAFLTGAYEVDTKGGTIPPHQASMANVLRSPGAQYWIPSADEWAKAAHYDPNRHGEGQGGYWLHPGMQDTPLFPELPENGGQTSAGLATLLDAGSYPHVQSPWGLLDTSGGEREWLDDYGVGTINDGRFLRNSSYLANLTSWDHIAAPGGGDNNARAGFRVAAVIPAPGGAAILSFTLLVSASRRSRR
ncbi:MAG: hypothetical protein EA379_10410 [Phycisphaerales bacterium]|nr:MAG: hypothetical protein EA379_10410 [Phycisphaerales bacterium]